jgi:hypothetical protein
LKERHHNVDAALSFLQEKRERSNFEISFLSSLVERIGGHGTGFKKLSRVKKRRV